MKTQTRVNILLVELLIVVLFFMLASTVLMRVFGEAHIDGERAELITRAAGEAQNAADRIAASKSFSEEIEKLFPVESGDERISDFGDFRLVLTWDQKQLEKGTLFTQELAAVSEDGSVLIRLPGAKYEEAEA